MSEIAHHIREQKLFGKSFGSAKSRALPTLKTPEDVIQVMVDVLSGLSNVTDYHIAWCGLPTIHELPVPFLAAVFRPTLKKLWLDISLENLKNLLYHSGFARLQSLEELDLFIRIENESPATNDTILDPHDHIMINYLAPALNQLHLTLRKLSIRLWQPLDLSPLFISLRPMPQLEHLSIEIPMSTPHLGNPVGLSDFLNLHSPHLRALSLRASEFSGMGLTPVDTSIRSWIGMAFPPVCLAKLQQLEISLALIPFESALVCLERFARTLTSLVLTGTYLSYSQISMMLDVLARKQPGGLQCLKMGSVTLSPQLVDSLAEKVQGLRQLKLLVREVVPCEGDLPIFYEKDQDDSQLVSHFSCSVGMTFLMSNFRANSSRRWPNDTTPIGNYATLRSCGAASRSDSSTSRSIRKYSRMVCRHCRLLPEFLPSILSRF